MKDETTQTGQTPPAPGTRGDQPGTPYVAVLNAAQLLGAADAALYEAKRQGRDRALQFNPQVDLERIAK